MVVGVCERDDVLGSECCCRDGGGVFNPFMMPPTFGGGIGSGGDLVNSGSNGHQQAPGLADMLKMMGGKLPPGLDMNSFEELAASISLQAHQQQQGKMS